MTLGRVDNVDQRSPLISVRWHVNEASLPGSESSLDVYECFDGLACQP